MSALPDDYTLVIEASTYIGSVALIRGTNILHAKNVEMRGRHEERLMPAVAECISALPEGIGSVSRVVCGAGPGSFTSLRIAAAIAKGICHGRGVPLFAVSSLALVAGESAGPNAGARMIVALDAARDDVYVSSFVRATDSPVPAHADVRIVPRASLQDLAKSEGAVVVEETPRASSAARMLGSILAAGPVDLAVWEPNYGRVAEAQVKWEAAHGRPLPR